MSGHQRTVNGRCVYDSHYVDGNPHGVRVTSGRTQRGAITQRIDTAEARQPTKAEVHLEQLLRKMTPAERRLASALAYAAEDPAVKDWLAEISRRPLPARQGPNKAPK